MEFIRFTFNPEDSRRPQRLRQSPEGEWVRYDDAQAKIDRLTAERDEAEAEVERVKGVLEKLSEIAMLHLKWRDQALAQAAAAALEMRKRATVTYAMYSGVDLTKRLNSLPIDPDAQKALDRMLAEAEQRGYANAMEAERKDADQRISKAREDAIRLSASIAEAWKAFDGEDYRPVEAAILALLTDGG